MSNSASDDTIQPILTKFEAQPDADIAIAAFVNDCNRDRTNETQPSAIVASRLTWPGAAPTVPLSMAMTSYTRFIPGSSSKAPAEQPHATKSFAPLPCPMTSSLLTLPVTPSMPKAPQLSPAPIPRARSQKWRSTSWFAAMEHGGSSQARIRRSDQVALSNPMAEDVVTMKGKVVVNH